MRPVAALRIKLVVAFFVAASPVSWDVVSAQTQPRGLSVAVIAPSVSTSMESRRIMQRFGWTETHLRNADAILVVVRSMLYDPLSYSYRSIKELQDDAEGQLNISGDIFHVYVYSIENDLSANQLKHTNYQAKD